MTFNLDNRRKKRQDAIREEIVMSLPGFINQMLLLMDSGMILSDAFRNIASEYEKLPERERNFFTEKVAEIAADSERTDTGVINGFYHFACGYGIKELDKTANYLYENKNRGTELFDSLSELAEDLWEERKRLCMEKIKKSELKMSFPLAIMLISLILMTSAPALMQIT